MLSDEIDDLSDQCLKLRDKKQCKKCFKEVNKEDNFCPNCGEKLEIDEEPAKEVEIVEKPQNEESKPDENEETKTNESEEKVENTEHKENLEKTVEVESNVEYVKDNEEEKED